MQKTFSKKFKVIGNIEATWRNLEGNITRKEYVKNLVCYPGVELMFGKLTGEYTGTLSVNKAALGSTPSITVTVNDTTLIHETYRNNIASKTADQNVIYLDAYFTATEVSGNFGEFGFVIDGGASSSIGTIWNRVEVNWSKTLSESLYIAGRWTLTNS